MGTVLIEEKEGEQTLATTTTEVRAPSPAIADSRPSRSIPYRRKQANIILTAADAANAASFGVSLDELRAGIKILAPNPLVRQSHPDAIVEIIQSRLKVLDIRNQDGSEIDIDGIFSIKLGTAIANLRFQLSRRGFELGNHIDSNLIEYLLPRLTIRNVELGFLEISQANSAQAEFPKLIKEVQTLINIYFEDAKLLVNGRWSEGLAAKLAEIQEQNFFKVSGRINAATLKLLRGANTRELIASGDAELIPCNNSGSRVPVDFVKTIQTLLNKYLAKNLAIDGIFSEETAAILEIAQKALAVSERRVFSKESYDALKTTLSSQDQRNAFLKHANEISLAHTLFSSLADSSDARALRHKMQLVSPLANTPELGLLRSLRALNIDIGSSTKIADFQRRREITQDGILNTLTAQNIYEVISAQWYSDRVRALTYKWRNNKQELNIVGLRGWSPISGRNDNAHNQWNDTIAFIWKDSHAQVHCKEYIATTDPGDSDSFKGLRKKKDPCGPLCLAQGQYSYVAGYLNGSSGVAIPFDGSDTNLNLPSSAPNFLNNLKNRFKTFFLGSPSFSIHWMEDYNEADNIEQVGRFSLGSQVPKVNKTVFKKEISPLFYADPEKVFFYTLIDMS